MLVSALGGHSRCICFSEVFNRRNSLFWARGLERGSRLVTAYRNRFPQQFLDRLVFGTHEDRILAVGFKVFPDQLVDPRFSDVLRGLIGAPQVGLIRLTRRNKLARHLSHVRARLNGVWSSNDGKADDQLPIRLDPERMIRALEQMDARDRLVDDLIRGHRVLALEYEQLIDDIPAGLERAQTHLGLPPEPIRPSVRRQRLVPITNSIANFDELRQVLAGTAWMDFLDAEIAAESPH